VKGSGWRRCRPRPIGKLWIEAELRIMHVLWGRASGTVQQVLDSIKEKASIAYNSVLTTSPRSGREKAI